MAFIISLSVVVLAIVMIEVLKYLSNRQKPPQKLPRVVVSVGNRRWRVQGNEVREEESNRVTGTFWGLAIDSEALSRIVNSLLVSSHVYEPVDTETGRVMYAVKPLANVFLPEYDIDDRKYYSQIFSSHPLYPKILTEVLIKLGKKEE